MKALRYITALTACLLISWTAYGQSTSIEYTETLRDKVQIALVDSLIRYELLKSSHVKLSTAYDSQTIELQSARLEISLRQKQNEAMQNMYREEKERAAKARLRTVFFAVSVGVLIGLLVH